MQDIALPDPGGGHTPPHLSHWAMVFLVSLLAHAGLWTVLDVDWLRRSATSAVIPARELAVNLVLNPPAPAKVVEPPPEEVPPPAPAEPPQPPQPPPEKVREKPPEPEKVVKKARPKSSPKPKPKPRRVHHVNPSPPPPPRPKPAPARPAVVTTPPEPVPAQVPRQLDVDRREALKADYLARLQAEIERHKYYPRLSRRRGEEGRVVVELLIGRRGGFREIRVQHSSGNRRLDEAALKTLKKIDPAAPLPAELGRDSWRISVPMVFSLRD